MSKKKFVLMLVVCAAVALGYEGGRLARFPAPRPRPPPFKPPPARFRFQRSRRAKRARRRQHQHHHRARAHPDATAQIPGEPGDPMQEFFRRFQIPMPQGDAIRRGVARVSS